MSSSWRSSTCSLLIDRCPTGISITRCRVNGMICRDCHIKPGAHAHLPQARQCRLELVPLGPLSEPGL
jgi:hypothetical protein